MGNQYAVRQTEPFVVPYGAAIPVRRGEWGELLDKMSLLREPARCEPDCAQYVLRSYYMILQRSNGVFTFPNLDEADARIERSGEFLCIQSGGKMWCPRFHSPPARSGLGKILGIIGKGVLKPRLEDYGSFVALLAYLSPHLEDALLYIADEESALYRLTIVNGQLLNTKEVSDRWCPLESWPASQLPDEKEANLQADAVPAPGTTPGPSSVR